jgi:hypothetical protein
MACDIKILSVQGKRPSGGTTASSVTVSGSATDCQQVKVTLYCDQPISTTVAVDQYGNWSIPFLNIDYLNCACGGNVSVTAVCVDDPDCSAERPFLLPCTIAGDCPYVDNINIIIDLEPAPDPLCFDEPTRVNVILTATGSPGAGLYEWSFGDGSVSSGSAQITTAHVYEFPGAYNITVQYTPSKSGCVASTAAAALVIPDCGKIVIPPPPPREETPPPKKTGDKPGYGSEPTRPGQQQVEGRASSAGCDGLLVAAVAALLLGGITIVVGICSKVPLVLLAGIAIAGIGAALFAIWWLLCGKISSCGTMRSLHCLLFLMTIGIGPVGAIIVALLAKSPTCIAAAFGYWGYIGSIYALLGWAMSAANCPKKCG